MTFEELKNQLLQIKPKNKALVIGIDGGGGAGKSSLAKVLAERLGGNVIGLDMFYKSTDNRVNENQGADVNLDFDWERVQNQIFTPIENNQYIKYQEYDWPSDSLTSFHTVPINLPIIIEGGYSLQNKFFNFYDFTIWVETSEGLRLKRALVRDGEHMRTSWQNIWLPADKRYKESHHPDKKANLIVDGKNSDFINDKIVLIK